MIDCLSCILFGKCSFDPTYCHSWDAKVAEGDAEMSTKSYAMETRDRLVEAGNFADADTDVDDVVQIIEDDEREIDRLEAENAKMREALKKITNSAYGLVGCLRYPCPHFDDEVTCKHCEYCSATIARDALAAEGGAK